MFHSAAMRLTVWYLAIIMAISLIFSVLLYQVSANDLTRNVNRQLGYFNNFLGPDDFNDYTALRENQLAQDEEHLRASLILFNVLVLAAGGVASYWLARRTLRPIEEVLDSQSRFAADASHELRTPLAAIQAENEVALRDASLNKSQAIKLLKSNLEEVAKLRTLSEGLLRLASGAAAGQPQPVPLDEAVSKAVDRLAKAAKLKRVKINHKSVNFIVRGEPDSLTELFSIFIDNAIKYSPAGGSVTVRAQKHHKDIQVSFSDKGKGVAAADLPHIFERFYQADSSRAKQGNGGYGLGLAIAKKIAEAHGGHIEAQSTPGKGSIFTVHLPSA